METLIFALYLLAGFCFGCAAVLAYRQRADRQARLAYERHAAQQRRNRFTAECVRSGHRRAAEFELSNGN